MIETHALRRTFRSRAGPVEAVAGVDLRVEAGEVFGFLGPNGAGKTTTLRMLDAAAAHRRRGHRRRAATCAANRTASVNASATSDSAAAAIPVSAAVRSCSFRPACTAPMPPTRAAVPATC